MMPLLQDQDTVDSDESVNRYIIHNKRKERHMTQEFLAAKIETSAQYVSRIERGQVCSSHWMAPSIKNTNTGGLNPNSNGAIINYISKMIYHQYIALSKANRKRQATVYIQDMNDKIQCNITPDAENAMNIDGC